MSKERESRRQPLSIIARLMGMEELPHQPLVHKQQKVPSESYKQRTELAGTEGCSYRKRSKEDQEFKDVFEVVETTKSNASSKLTEAKVDLFRQKVMDAKLLSTDEKLQGSKEFDDTLDLLDSNKELFLKCLQDPNSLYGKHLRELQGLHPQSHCRRVLLKTTSEAKKCSSNGVGFISDGDTTSKNHTTLYKKHYSDSHCYPSYGGTNKALKSSMLRSEYEQKNRTTVSTRIVVLKPNLEMAQTKSFSSPHSSHTFPSNNRMLTELPNDIGAETKLRRKKIASVDDGISIQKSKESREIAKKITRRIKNSLSIGSLDCHPSGFQGYARDQSSYYTSGNDSATESEVTTLASRRCFDRYDRDRHSLSNSSDSSSVNREAKRRLSERWKMSHRFQEVGLAGKSSTLGEVLAISDRKEKAEMLDLVFDQSGSSERFVGIERSAERVCPGISSKDGWKEDGGIRNLSRSKSLPASSTSLENPKTNMQYGAHRADRNLIPKDAVNQGRNKGLKKHSNQKDGSVASNSRSGARKPESSRCAERKYSDRVLKCHISKNQLKTFVEEAGISEENVTMSDTLICKMTEKSLSVGEVDVEQEDMVLPSEFPADTVTERSNCLLVGYDSPTRDLDNSFVKETCGPSEESPVSFSHTVHGPECPAHSKETEQPSPASVLDAPFLDDLSPGSECFGSLSADLQGLRMQLQLLRLESEEYAEGTMTISSDEDGEDDSMEVTNERGTVIADDNWESLYVADVLIESCFDNADPDTFMAAWHSPDCPIDYSVFNQLEKKYCDQTNWLRSKRRILFDRINSGLVEMFQECMHPHPWVKPFERRVSLKRGEKVIIGYLHELLANQEKMAIRDNSAEKVMGRVEKWLDLEDDIDVIGRELEKLLIDDLLVECIII